MKTLEVLSKFRDEVNTIVDRALDEAKLVTDDIAPGTQVFCVTKKTVWKNQESAHILVSIHRTRAAAEKSVKLLNDLTKDMHGVETFVIAPEA
jgi:hypothetical protein